AIAIAPQREMPAGQLPLELAASRLAKHRDVIIADAARVLLHLLEEAAVAVFAGYAAHDLVDQLPLLIGVEVIVNGRLGYSPVSADSAPQLMVKGETNHLLLLGAEGVVEP